MIGCSQKRSFEKISYPEAKKDTVVDMYFGTAIPDPYRWLEDPDAPDTRSWVDAQNAITAKFLSANSERDRIKTRLTKLWDYPKYDVPSKEGGRYFFSKNDGLQNQSVLYMRKSLSGESVKVLDPNAFSADGTVALANAAYSRDGTLLAYGTSRSGSDKEEIRIRKVDTGEEFEETLHWCKFTSIAWRKDGKGFFYNRFPEEGTVAKEDENNYSRVYYHALGSPQSKDTFVYGDDNDKERGFSPFVTEDGLYLGLYVWKGTSPKNRIYIREVDGKEPFTKLLDAMDASYAPIGNVGSLFYFLTNLDASHGRIVAIDLNNSAPAAWKEIITEGKDVISSASIIHRSIVVSWMKDARHELRIYGLDGAYEKDVALPTIGSVTGVNGRLDDTEMFFGFTSFLFPPAAYRYDFSTGRTTQVFESGIDFDPTRFETRQAFYPSKDGTKIPLFITHRKGIDLNGGNPTLLYGYGGFDAGITPYFSISRLAWMESGGVFAVACIRGGNEYGESWHEAGMLEKKQNVFDDFIAAGEWLISNKYTSSDLLAINGASNGGLLVAACELQRPDLFGAVVCQVPVIDMLRYHRFTVGRYWVPEYGNAEENAEHFKFLFAYSPLHNVKKGATYPPTLVTTADTDDRVAPLHAKKFVATMQANDSGKNPILLRVETKAGHGGGKPTGKIIEEMSDIYAFLFKIFGMKLAG